MSDLINRKIAVQGVDDLISRKAVLNEIRKIECEPGYQHQGEDWAVGLCIAESIVEGAESAEPERKKGRWIEYPECLGYDGAYSDDHIVCSECEHVFSILDNCTEEFDFCPHCGAELRGDNETDK